MTGSTDAIASASKASKKVATPTMMRALTCHHEVGRRSSRATMSSTGERVPTGSISSSRSRRGFGARPRSSRRQLEDPRRILVTDLGARLVVERDAVDEVPGLLDRLEGVVGGKPHALAAERADRAVERLGRAHARGGDDDVVLDVLRGPLGELDGVEVGAGAAVETPQQEGQRLAQ